MKGYVRTPRETVDSMVELLFQRRLPNSDDTLLDPGCGTGEFIDGVIRWCERQQRRMPLVTGVESDPHHLPVLRAKYEHLPAVRIQHADFLIESDATYNFIVGNPPYVAITALSEGEKGRYRKRYSTARGRFDLYLLFFEQAMRNLAPGGRLVFITPEKYLYVHTAGPLRALLAHRHVDEIHLVSEDTFGTRVTYPTITAVNNMAPDRTRVSRRDGSTTTVMLRSGPAPWVPVIQGAAPRRAVITLGDLCSRISCGVATGADSVFVQPADELDTALRRFAHPTLAGRELKHTTLDLTQRFVMLIPYDMNGRLLPFGQLGELGPYLMRNDVRQKLLARTCVKRKPWYAFHETPVLRDILRPKILCKDICEAPRFWVDRSGRFVPRHSIYYIVPRDPGAIEVITDYLRSRYAHEWLTQNCQRASKGFLRLQSRVLQQLPVPDDVVHAAGGDPLLSQNARRPLQTELCMTPGEPDEHAV